jgi:hypothetical protein
MKRNSAKSSPRGLAIKTYPTLPEHFADQVLEYETQLDLDCTISTIMKLMELYSVRSN